MTSTIDLDKLILSYQDNNPETLIKNVLDKFGDKIALASSLSIEDQVITDMMLKYNKDARIFIIDTGKLHIETLALLNDNREKYNREFEIYSPEKTEVDRMIAKHGESLYYNSIEERKLCCEIRKLKPLQKALSTLDVWITGIRRDQSITRSDINIVEWDETNEKIKINPLAFWSEEEVWNYIKKNKISYNKLHDQNYPSIGCAPCTRPVNHGEDIRAGRWWWENPEQKECGLHKR